MKRFWAGLRGRASWGAASQSTICSGISGQHQAWARATWNIHSFCPSHRAYFGAGQATSETYCLGNTQQMWHKQGLEEKQTTKIQKGSFQTKVRRKTNTTKTHFLHCKNDTVIRGGSQPLQGPHCLQWSRHWARHVIITADGCRVTPRLHNRQGYRNGPQEAERTHCCYRRPLLPSPSATVNRLLRMYHSSIGRLSSWSQSCCCRVCVEATRTKPQKRHYEICRSLWGPKLGDEGGTSSAFWWRRAPISSFHVQPMGKRSAIRSDIFGVDRKFCRPSGGLCMHGYRSALVCVCVVAFPLPADPAQPGGAAGKEMLWKLLDVNITSCLLCACVCWWRGVFPLHPHPHFIWHGGVGGSSGCHVY